MAGRKPEFEKRNRKIFGLSVDPVEYHRRWAKDIEATSGYAVTYPMIGDPKLNVHLARSRSTRATSRSPTSASWSRISSF